MEGIVEQIPHLRTKFLLTTPRLTSIFAMHVTHDLKHTVRSNFDIRRSSFHDCAFIQANRKHQCVFYFIQQERIIRRDIQVKTGISNTNKGYLKPVFLKKLH